MDLKRRLRDTIRVVAPRVETVLHARNLRHHFANEFTARQQSLKLKIYGSGGPIVLSGPFKGLAYLDEIVWGPIEPKWVGTYERELHGVVEAAKARGYATIIDIGSAEGYYSVGLAWALPNATIHSFDVDPWGRAQQRRLAKLNNVHNVKIGGFCSHKNVTDLQKERTFLICDIEGYEYGFLDTVKCPALIDCDILVEIHPSLDGRRDAAAGADLLAAQFDTTHRVTRIAAQARDPTSAPRDPALAALSDKELNDCVDERRDYQQYWLWLESRRTDLQN